MQVLSLVTRPCRSQAWGILVTGHPSAEYNGAYQRTSRRRFRNSDDMYCYRHEPKDLWILRNKHTPDQPNCNACIVSKDGPLPFGAQTWKLSPTAVGNRPGHQARGKIMLRQLK